MKEQESMHPEAKEEDNTDIKIFFSLTSLRLVSARRCEAQARRI